jgi:hypothetical protein
MMCCTGGVSASEGSSRMKRITKDVIAGENEESIGLRLPIDHSRRQ